MRKQEAIQIVKSTFSGNYNAQLFHVFITNLLKSYTQLDKVREGQYIREAYRPFVSRYRIIGNFKDVEGNKVDILEVFLTKSTSLERARTAQRNFISDYLKNNAQGKRDAALVVFISPSEEDWRFSLVKLEYSLDLVEGKIKTKEEITPAKRWSFLVGRNEGTHTLQSRFISLLENDNEPNLTELEDAFNIEKVTNEFFNKYCELFHLMKDHLDRMIEKDDQLQKDFEAKEISTVDFAKKTLGQMAFLYFLQKKGWFGVKAEDSWGEGRKDFMRRLFDWRKDFSDYHNNFFNDILEPLFYEGLSSDLGNDNIYDRLSIKGQKYRMPFLNGGLFSPMNEYSWKTTEINLPDDLFSNSNKTKEGDTGDGILDIFDRYNFTVNENEPLEKEVAVDPEMLGKVFENLLEVKDRKTKGAYYTPREIVHFMCQECLINYLHSEAGENVSRENLIFFIQKGIQIIHNDENVIVRGKETGSYKFLLPSDIRNTAKKLDFLLAKIKVCDPAVGSGAFPLGMLNEIVRARQVLGIHLRNNLSLYDLKIHTISHSIYGVDIDSGAVEIAKLRLWLSLVVEENEPHPLPNLEHKLMQGNSLIEEYEGIKLFDDSFLEDSYSIDKDKIEINDKLSHLQQEYFDLFGKGELSPVKKLEIEREIKLLQKRIKSYAKGSKEILENSNLFDIPHKKKLAQQKTQVLQKKIEEFIYESRRSLKQKLKEEIDNLKWELIEVSLEEQGQIDKLKEIKGLRHKNIRPFFIWKLEFSDVFKENGGFDIVIANPPYVGEKGNKEIFRPIAQGNLGKYYQGKMDLFYFFFHLALDLGRKHAQNAFITTNYYITAMGARKFRADLKERSSIRYLINFNELRIFESALGQHNMITIFSKGHGSQIKAKTCITRQRGTANEEKLKTIVLEKDKETDYFSVDQFDLYDGSENYIRLGGVENIDCPIERILDKVKVQGASLGGKEGVCKVNQGLHTGADKVSKSILKKYDFDAELGEGIFVLSPKELEKLNLTNREKQQILPLFKNSDISKYTSTVATHLYFIDFYYPKHKSIDRCEYPNLFEHLGRFRPLLENRVDSSLSTAKKFNIWWVIGLRKLIDYEAPKIVVPQRSKSNTFGYNEIPWYAASDVFFITSKDFSGIELKYILALLNSKLYFQWLFHRGKRKGQTLELIAKPLSEIPIKIISPEKQKPFVNIVSQILYITSKTDYDPKKPTVEQLELEAKIDEMVFDLYSLTEEERKVITDS
jgi:adenine-specific DNA-methyltransferase